MVAQWALKGQTLGKPRILSKSSDNLLVNAVYEIIIIKTYEFDI